MIPWAFLALCAIGSLAMWVIVHYTSTETGEWQDFVERTTRSAKASKMKRTHVKKGH